MPQSAHHVLVVGAGSIGHRHIRCFLATGRTAVSFVEPRPEIRRQLQSLYAGVDSFATLEDVPDDVPINAAVIATPAPAHLSQATSLLKRGLHLLIEKPLAIDLVEAERFLSLAQTSDKIVAVAYVYRANLLLAQMREALRSGEYGRPLELIAYCGQNFPTYRPGYQDTYYRHHESGGGAIQDALTHVFNAGEWLVGEMQRIVVDADHLVLAGVEVEDTVHALARHANNVMASYTLNQHQSANELTITVVCQHGVLRFENHRQRWRVTTQPDTPWRDFHAAAPAERDDLFIRQANAFLDATEGLSEPLCDLSSGLATLRANLAALASWRSGSWQSTNPDDSQPDA